MINPFKLKKWGALLIAGILPVLFFYLILVTNGLFYALGAMLVGCLLGVLIGTSLLKNPFSDVLEGKGLLTLNLTSTGIIQAFILPFNKNFVKGYLNGEEVQDYFDREATAVINPPKVVKGVNTVMKTEDGGLLFKIDGDKLSDSRFAFNQFPVLIYNSMSGTFFSKDQLAEFEKKIISYNKLVFLIKRVEDLTMSVKNFARHIVDNLKPKALGGGLPSWILIILVLGVIGVVIYMILQSGGGGAIGGAVSAASSSLPSGGVVVPT